MTNHDNLTPDPCSSDRQYHRFCHLDLPDLEDFELTDEIYYLRSVLWGSPIDHWCRQRVMALETEISKRRGYTRIISRPKLAEGVQL